MARGRKQKKSSRRQQRGAGFGFSFDLAGPSVGGLAPVTSVNSSAPSGDRGGNEGGVYAIGPTDVTAGMKGGYTDKIIANLMSSRDVPAVQSGGAGYSVDGADNMLGKVPVYTAYHGTGCAGSLNMTPPLIGGGRRRGPWKAQRGGNTACNTSYEVSPAETIGGMAAIVPTSNCGCARGGGISRRSKRRTNFRRTNKSNLGRRTKKPSVRLATLKNMLTRRIF
jgi:hypothetical protein